MDEKPELYITELKPWLHLLDEGHSATGYVIEGDDKVCVIDTMCGFTDIKSYIRSFTDKPVIVINTHGHGDHILGNVYFDEAYMNPKDKDLADLFINSPEFTEICEKNGFKMPPFKPVKDGDVFDLGGKTLEVYELPGHTAGSIILLLKEERILFSGDAINHHLWMMLDGCTPLPEYVDNLDRIMFLEDKADLILHGHSRGFDDISLIRCMRQGIADICDGKTAEDKPYEYFGGTARQHEYELLEGKQYSQYENSVICYNP